jgi:alpha-glucosidase
MKTLALAPWLLSVLSVAVFVENGAAQSSYDLRSPDGRIEIRIRTEGRIRYDVVLKGRAVLEDCTLSLDVEHKKFGAQPKLVEAKERSYDQVVEPVVRQKFAKIRDHYNELKLTMEGGYAVVFRAYNEGAAYRFETSLGEAQVKIYGEESAFNFSANNIVYYPQEDSFYSHNERKYLPQHLSEIAPAFLATLPAVVDVGEGAKVAIAESDLESYPGLWLARNLEIDLSFLPEGNFTMEAYQDGVNADRYASDYKKTTMQVNRTTKLKLPLASGGGWAARIHQ